MNIGAIMSEINPNKHDIHGLIGNSLRARYWCNTVNMAMYRNTKSAVTGQESAMFESKSVRNLSVVRNHGC